MPAVTPSSHVHRITHCGGPVPAVTPSSHVHRITHCGGPVPAVTPSSHVHRITHCGGPVPAVTPSSHVHRITHCGGPVPAVTPSSQRVVLKCFDHQCLPGDPRLQVYHRLQVPSISYIVPTMSLELVSPPVRWRQMGTGQVADI